MENSFLGLLLDDVIELLNQTNIKYKIIEGESRQNQDVRVIRVRQNGDTLEILTDSFNRLNQKEV